jgi:hypothetical protein
MTCREFRARFVELAFGDLAAAERLLCEEHLHWCVPCNTEWHDYHKVIRLARQLRPWPLPPSLRSRLRNGQAQGHIMPC